MNAKHSQVTGPHLGGNITWQCERSRGISCLHLLSFGVGEEVVRPDIFAKHHIVVEVNELLGKSRNAVDVGLDGRGAESGKMALILEDVLEVIKKKKFKNPIVVDDDSITGLGSPGG